MIINFAKIFFITEITFKVFILAAQNDIINTVKMYFIMCNINIKSMKLVR